MPFAFSSGDFVKFPEGAGKILNIIGTTSDLTKAVQSGESGILARIRLVEDNKLTDTVVMLPIEQLENDFIPDLAPMTKAVTTDNLEETLSKYSDAERTLLATAHFSQILRPLPRHIVGEEGERNIPDSAIHPSPGNLA